MFCALLHCLLEPVIGNSERVPGPEPPSPRRDGAFCGETYEWHGTHARRRCVISSTNSNSNFILQSCPCGPVSQALLEFLDFTFTYALGAYLVLTWRLLGGIERSIF